MSQYQKHLGNAIFRQSGRQLSALARTPLRWRVPLWARGGLAMLSVLLCLIAPNVAFAVGLAVPLPAQQTTGTLLLPPLITPLESTTVELLTHTADFTLLTSDPSTGDSALTLQLDATYRLENGAAEPVSLILKIAEPAAVGATAELALAADGLPLTLFQTEGVGYTTQLQLNADTRTTVALRYVVTVAGLALPLLSYDASVLTAWRGNPSIRVSIGLPPEAGPESWLHVAPDSWRYAQVSDSAIPGIKWLYDVRIPDTPFVFEFIHPAQWRRLQQLIADAANNLTAYRILGDQYSLLLNAVPMTPSYVAVRNRFYSQALAAYTAGIDQLTAAGQSGTELGALYTALAALYRTQVAQADGSTNPAYAAAMVDAAQQALAQLSADASRRTELTQWVADGLQATLVDAQAREAWSTALATIEQLAALPPDLVNRDILDRTRRSIIVRQALKLLEEDNRAAALALAGADLLDEQLLPPIAQRALVSRWEISTTVTPTTMEVMVQPMTALGNQAAALVAFEQLVNQLRAAADPMITLVWQPTDGTAGTPGAADLTDQQVGQLLIRAPSDSSLASLTTAIPAQPEWLLFYTFLRQLQPMVETQAAWFNETTTLRLRLDLPAVATDWQQVAAGLETAAAQLEATAAARNTRDAAEAESALRARIQAANYRAAAQEWRKLARDSWVLLQLSIPGGLQAPMRTWLITLDAPAQVAELQSTPSYFISFIGGLMLSLMLLLLLSGLLWWLL